MFVKSIKSKANAKRNAIEMVADWLTARFGSVMFLLINALWFIIWISINLDLIPSVEPFDPFPFGLLTMIVSLEAIFLSIIVLISQNREEKINDLRQEADLQLDIYMEKEITKVLRLVSSIAKKTGIDISEDEELQKMLKPMDVDRIEKILEGQINKS